MVATEHLLASSTNGHTAVVGLADGRVHFNGGGPWTFTKMADGSIALISASSDGMTGGGSTAEQLSIVVVRPDGQRIDLPGREVTVGRATDGDFADVVFVDGAPVSLADPGAGTRWTAAPISEGWNGVSMDVAAGDAVVMVNRAVPEVVVVDSQTGEVRWRSEIGAPSIEAAAVTDGRRIIVPGVTTALEARDLATGSPLWSVPATVMTSNPASTLVNENVGLLAIGDHLVAVNGAGITGFAPTGGRAYPPGYTPEDAGGGTGDDEITVTRCDSVPEFRAEQFLTDTAGLKVNFRVTTGCSDGDLVNGRDVEITIGDAGDLVAGGIFDFSGSPLVIPPPDDGSDDVTVELTFPPGSFLRLPDTLDDSVDDLEVTCRRGYGAGPSSVTVRREATGPSLTVSAPAVGEGETGLAVDYLSALRRQANADRAFIEEHLDDRWVAQLSSKRPGLRADGKVWDEQAILHCYAKLISTTAGPQNTTRYLN